MTARRRMGALQTDETQCSSHPHHGRHHPRRSLLARGQLRRASIPHHSHPAACPYRLPVFLEPVMLMPSAEQVQHGRTQEERLAPPQPARRRRADRRVDFSMFIIRLLRYSISRPLALLREPQAIFKLKYRYSVLEGQRLYPFAQLNSDHTSRADHSTQ